MPYVSYLEGLLNGCRQNGIDTQTAVSYTHLDVYKRQVMETAGEGGPWGMAILAAYMADKTSGESLERYLKNRVFAAEKKTTIQPQKEDVAGFAAYLKNYKAALTVEKAAADALQ